MYKMITLISTSLLLVNLSVEVKESSLDKNNDTYLLKEKESEKQKDFDTTGVWFPGDLEDEEQP